MGDIGKTIAARWRSVPERPRLTVMTVAYALAGAAMSVLFLKLTHFFYAKGLPVMAGKGVWTFGQGDRHAARPLPCAKPCRNRIRAQTPGIWEA